MKIFSRILRTPTLCIPFLLLNIDIVHLSTTTHRLYLWTKGTMPQILVVKGRSPGSSVFKGRWSGIASQPSQIWRANARSKESRLAMSRGSRQNLENWGLPTVANCHVGTLAFTDNCLSSVALELIIVPRSSSLLFLDSAPELTLRLRLCDSGVSLPRIAWPWARAIPIALFVVDSFALFASPLV